MEKADRKESGYNQALISFHFSPRASAQSGPLQKMFLIWCVLVGHADHGLTEHVMQ